MKRQHLLRLFLLVFASMSLVSCENEPIDSQLNVNDFGDDNGTNNPNNPGNAIFKVDFQGQTWLADDADAVLYTNSLQIGGIKTSTGQVIAFSLNGSTTGTYDSTSNLIIYEPNNNSSSGDFYWALNPTNPSISAGSVTITNIDLVNNKVSGTFAFTGYWSDPTVTNIPPIVFTNGVFTNIPLSTGTNPSGDLFFAKLDGSEFVENQIDVTEVIASGFPDSYSIVGSKPDGQNIGFRFAKSLGVGTYNFNGPFDTNLSSACLLGGLLYTSDTGVLTITEKTATRVKGTFSIVVSNFTTSQIRNITEGSFDVELPD